MAIDEQRQPALVVEYTDAEEGFRGWLVIDTLDHSMCAGGMRVQPGLTRDRLAGMARNMTCKMRICGLRVDGAKSGIDYDPNSPGKRAAMTRFMQAISPYIRSRYSMGPDLNVEMTELETIGNDLGLDSVKMAVAGAQGFELPYFKERYRVLSQEIDGYPLGRIRAGYGVAAAALAVFDHFAIPPRDGSVVIQGFGTLARAAAYGLEKQGVRVMAVADAEKSIISQSGQGLDIAKLLRSSGSLLPAGGYGPDVKIGARDEIFDVPCDILMPAAVENAVTEEIAGRIQVKAVVPGANLAVTPEADELLYERGIVVLPDLLTGSGGSLSMEGLFGPAEHPDAAEVLAHVGNRMTGLVKQILDRSRAENISPSRAALRTCGEIVPQPDARPYGHTP